MTERSSKPFPKDDRTSVAKDMPTPGLLSYPHQSAAPVLLLDPRLYMQVDGRCLRLCFLERRHYAVAERHPVTAILWGMTESGRHTGGEPIAYAISLSDAHTQVICCVGEEQALAETLFTRIADGCLAPEHLPDVVADACENA